MRRPSTTTSQEHRKRPVGRPRKHPIRENSNKPKESKSKTPQNVISRGTQLHFGIERIYPKSAFDLDDFSGPILDRTLEIEVSYEKKEQSFFVDPHIMVAVSNHFREVLKDGMDSTSTVSITQESPDRFLLMLKAIHPCLHPILVNSHNFAVLTSMSLKYRVPHLHGLCQEFVELNVNSIPKGNIRRLYEHLALRPGEKPWVFNFLTQHIASIYSHHEIDELSISDDIRKQLITLHKNETNKNSTVMRLEEEEEKNPSAKKPRTDTVTTSRMSGSSSNKLSSTSGNSLSVQISSEMEAFEPPKGGVHKISPVSFWKEAATQISGQKPRTKAQLRQVLQAKFGRSTK